VNLIILFGPPAVGKMTVGTALAERTGLKLFHNHMTIELVLQFFPFGHAQFGKLVGEFRRRIFEEVARSDLPGLIFTYVWALDNPGDKAQIDAYCQIFRDQGASIFFVELEAALDERLKRNTGAFRLAQKPSKRDIVNSERRLLEADSQYKLNSRTDDFFYSENYLKIDNTTLSPDEVAQQIIQNFGLQTTPDESAASAHMSS
jgi:AAA domain